MDLIYPIVIQKSNQSMNMIKKTFSDQVFQKPWNGFRIVSSASMKYSSVRKEKTLLMYRSLHYQKTERDMTALDRFLNKEKWHSQVIWKFTFFREYCQQPERQLRSHCGFMHTFEKKTFLSLQMQRNGHIIWSKPPQNFVWYLHSLLFINVSIAD